MLADSTKWGLSGLYRIADLADVDTLVADDALDDHARYVLGQHIPDL